MRLRKPQFDAKRKGAVMVRVVWVLVLAAVGWSGWWALAARGTSGGIEAWLEERRAAGWQAEAASVSTSGYPVTLDTVILNLAVADPGTGVAVEVSRLDFSSAAWWPGDVVLTLPAEPILFANPAGRAELTTETARADLQLHPGEALELEGMALTSGPWSLTENEGDLLAATDLTVSMLQDAEDPAVYDISANATALQPGPVLRERFFIPTDWPVSFESLTLQMTVAFDRPWDRRALEQSRPQPRRIDLPLAEAAWGDLRLRLAADLEVNAEAVPSGTVTLQARNWREMLKLAQSAGLLPAELRPQVESILSALAGTGGNPEAFDVTLTLANGRVSMGFLPLGPAPRIYLR
jgi:hypothetical protein